MGLEQAVKQQTKMQHHRKIRIRIITLYSLKRKYSRCFDQGCIAEGAIVRYRRKYWCNIGKTKISQVKTYKRNNQALRNKIDIKIS